MDAQVRLIIVHYLSALTQPEFDALVAEARGNSDGEPSAADYRAVAQELQSQTLDGKRALAAQRLAESVRGQKG